VITFGWSVSCDASGAASCGVMPMGVSHQTTATSA
jgi:hypothetical protein